MSTTMLMEEQGLRSPVDGLDPYGFEAVDTDVRKLDMEVAVATEDPIAPCDGLGEVGRCQTVEEFVARVIVDGRFLETFTVEPAAVARALRVDVAPEVLDDLCGQDPCEVLARTTPIIGEEIQVAPDGPVAAAWIVGVVIGAAIVGVVGVVIYTAAGTALPDAVCEVGVTDESPDADSKL